MGGVKIGGYVISDDRNKEEFSDTGKEIFHLSEISRWKEEYEILVAVADPDVRVNLRNYSLKYIDVPNYIFPFIKDYVKLLC